MEGTLWKSQVLNAFKKEFSFDAFHSEHDSQNERIRSNR